ncbi:hypothetical protein ACFUIW_33690 [Streptomyces sp. NPDC057245]|uniref:hypothetical protein n=1 Tax=Streptomyces sp. NPDC057245 TaxID=3346065 RepID=UPI0036338880
MSRRKPRSRGVSLRGRAVGPHRSRSEARVDGGKRYLRHVVRARGKAELRGLQLDAEHDSAVELAAPYLTAQPDPT